MRTTPRCPEKPRVLVVEDHDDARESLRVLLSIYGCDVRVAGDGLDGVRQAFTWRPEVVISDIDLPSLDGWQVGRQLRAGLGDKAFLVAVTGSARPGDAQRSREAGFDAHLSKPADPRTLLQLLCVSA